MSELLMLIYGIFWGQVGGSLSDKYSFKLKELQTGTYLEMNVKDINLLKEY